MSYHLKLVKALSYCGVVKATKAQPYVDVKTEEEANTLVATGYFELCSSPATDNPEEDTDEETTPDYEALSEMTKAELTAYAEANEIDIEGCKTKADILEAISAANGGSYTMMEMQKEQ